MKNNKQLVKKDIGDLSSALAGLWSGLPVVYGVRAWTPAVDVEQTDKEYVLTLDLPGVDKKDLKVDVSDGVLTLKGERSEKDFYGQFQRSFVLPETVKAKEIKASFKGGILEVTLPKAKEAKSSLTVKIN